MALILQFPNHAERAQDEAELAQMAAKRAAREANKPEPYVSPYLERRLRSETEVRAERLHPLFESIIDMVRP
jgi:hypothetical protein